MGGCGHPIITCVGALYIAIRTYNQHYLHMCTHMHTKFGGVSLARGPQSRIEFGQTRIRNLSVLIQIFDGWHVQTRHGVGVSIVTPNAN